MIAASSSATARSLAARGVRFVKDEGLASAEDLRRRQSHEQALHRAAIIENRERIEAERIARDRRAWIERRRTARVREFYIVAHALLENDTPDARISSSTVLREIAFEHQFTPDEIKGAKRNRKLVAARQHAMYEIARRCTHLSIAQIGRILNKDHTTVLHALKQWPVKASSLGLECEPLGRGED